MKQRLEEIIAFRKKKLEQLRARGVDPYPSSTQRTHTNADVLARFDEIGKASVSVVGRIRSWRAMGKIVFVHIQDGTAQLQLLLKEERLGDQFRLVTEFFDLGDFLECTGTLFRTKTGEKTVEAASVRMLAKALLPLPSDHYRITDEEALLRKRYLDLLLHQDVKELFARKNVFWSSMRQFLVEQGFLEFDLPVLENVPGGAEAEPFVTHHNALNQDFFLRISLELPLKKLLVAGFERVFEIGRIFRNEGIDAEHLQDYLQMEFYWAYADFAQLQQFLQRMYQHIIQTTFGTLDLPFGDTVIHWGGEWPRKDYVALFAQHTGLDLLAASDDDVRAFARRKNLEAEPGAGRGRLIDLIFKKTIRPLPDISMQPSFLIHQPLELEPLAKRDPANPRVVQRLQIMACGTELGKGFGELNDPVDQRARFEEQMRLRAAGDSQAQQLDESYLEAMEYGMPPAAGFGVSERLFAVLCNRSIRETVVFPPMRRKA